MTQKPFLLQLNLKKTFLKVHHRPLEKDAKGNFHIKCWTRSFVYRSWKSRQNPVFPLSASAGRMLVPAATAPSVPSVR